MASSENQQRPEVHTEADVDARLVIPYLTSLGIQPDQIRAQRSFTIRLGRAPVDVKRRNSVRGGRLDILVSRSDGRPLFIIEEKGPNEILTDEDSSSESFITP